MGVCVWVCVCPALSVFEFCSKFFFRALGFRQSWAQGSEEAKLRRRRTRRSSDAATAKVGDRKTLRLPPRACVLSTSQFAGREAGAPRERRHRPRAAPLRSSASHGADLKMNAPAKMRAHLSRSSTHIIECRNRAMREKRQRMKKQKNTKKNLFCFILIFENVTRRGWVPLTLLLNRFSPFVRKVASSQAAKYVSETNGETSRVSTQQFTVSRHEKMSCTYMKDMYCDNDYINMTPTRCSALITTELGDEQIMRGQFIGRAEQHLQQHYYIPVRRTCTTSEVGW